MKEQVQKGLSLHTTKIHIKSELKQVTNKGKKKQQNTIVHKKKNQKYHKPLRKPLITKSGETPVP